MFRSQPYLEKTAYVQVNLDTSLTYPENNQTQNKSGHKFTIRDRDNFHDWYNAYFRVDFKFEAVANGASIGTDTESAPINGSFSLIKSLNLKSAEKTLYEGTDIHKVIFIKNLLDFSDDFSRSVTKNQFWYLDSDTTTVTDGNATNVGMRARALLSHGGAVRLLPPMQLEFDIALQNDREMIFQNDGTARRIVVRRLELWVPQLQFTGQGQTLVNENFLRPTQWKYLKEVLHSSTSRRDANSTWLITPAVKNPKHVRISSTNPEKKFLYAKPLHL